MFCELLQEYVLIIFQMGQQRPSRSGIFLGSHSQLLKSWSQHSGLPFPSIKHPSMSRPGGALYGTDHHLTFRRDIFIATD